FVLSGTWLTRPTSCAAMNSATSSAKEMTPGEKKTLKTSATNTQSMTLTATCATTNNKQKNYKIKPQIMNGARTLAAATRYAAEAARNNAPKNHKTNSMSTTATALCTNMNKKITPPIRNIPIQKTTPFTTIT